MTAGLGIVRPVPIVFGQAGTQTGLAGPTTNTSNPMNMPRENFTLQVTAYATGTSEIGAAVRWQSSNDANAWIDISSATASSTRAAATGTTVTMSAVAYTNAQFAYGRAVVIVTGTGSSDLKLAF